MFAVKNETCELNVPAADVWTVTSSFVTRGKTFTPRLAFLLFRKNKSRISLLWANSSVQGFHERSLTSLSRFLK